MQHAQRSVPGKLAGEELAGVAPAEVARARADRARGSASASAVGALLCGLLQLACSGDEPKSNANGFSSLTQTGWSIQSSEFAMDGAGATVSAAGQAMPVSVVPLMGRYGNSSGIRIDPNGWDVEAGVTYRVSVSGVPVLIDYEVHIVDCD